MHYVIDYSIFKLLDASALSCLARMPEHVANRFLQLTNSFIILKLHEAKFRIPYALSTPNPKVITPCIENP